PDEYRSAGVAAEGERGRQRVGAGVRALERDELVGAGRDRTGLHPYRRSALRYAVPEQVLVAGHGEGQVLGGQRIVAGVGDRQATGEAAPVVGPQLVRDLAVGLVDDRRG